MRVPTEHLPYLAGQPPRGEEIPAWAKGLEIHIPVSLSQQMMWDFCVLTELGLPTAHLPKRCIPKGYKTPYAKPKRRTRHAGTIFPSAPHGNRAVRRKDMKGVRRPTKNCTNRRKH